MAASSGPFSRLLMRRSVKIVTVPSRPANAAHAVPSDVFNAEPPAFAPHSPGERQNLCEAEAAGLPFLMWRDAQASQRIFALGGGDRLTVGRRTSCDLVLDDPHVSRVHAELKPIAGDWVLLDGGISHNGTFVNGEQIVSRALVDGDVLRFGKTHALYRRPPRRGSMVTISTSFSSAGRALATDKEKKWS